MSSTSTVRPKDLIPFALDSNKAHQIALTEYAQSLTDELKELDKLLHIAERENEESDQAQISIQLSNTKKAVGLLNVAALSRPESPFVEEIGQRMKYLTLITPKILKPKELELFDEAVKNENVRLMALQTKDRGSSNIDVSSNTEGINWKIVAEKLSDAVSNKWTAEECRYKWVHDRNPTVNWKEWNSRDIEALRKCVSAVEPPVDWVGISKKLNTGRLPLDCMRKYLSLQHRSMYNWKASDDKQLQEAVGIYGTGNWGLVARYVAEDVTAAQCEARHERLFAGKTKGPWSKEEDERLDIAMKGWGQSWGDVAIAMHGRTNDQCRDRYFERQKNSSPWTAWEDETLVAAVNSYGPKWTVILGVLNTGRTDTDIRHRYQKLMNNKGRTERRRTSAPLQSPTPPPAASPAATTTSDSAGPSIQSTENSSRKARGPNPTKRRYDSKMQWRVAPPGPSLPGRFVTEIDMNMNAQGPSSSNATVYPGPVAIVPPPSASVPPPSAGIPSSASTQGSTLTRPSTPMDFDADGFGIPTQLPIAAATQVPQPRPKPRRVGRKADGQSVTAVEGDTDLTAEPRKRRRTGEEPQTQKDADITAEPDSRALPPTGHAKKGDRAVKGKGKAADAGTSTISQDGLSETMTDGSASQKQVPLALEDIPPVQQGGSASPVVESATADTVGRQPTRSSKRTAAMKASAKLVENEGEEDDMDVDSRTPRPAKRGRGRGRGRGAKKRS